MRHLGEEGEAIVLIPVVEYLYLTGEIVAVHWNLLKINRKIK